MTDNLTPPTLTDSAQESLYNLFPEFSFEKIISEITKGSFNPASSGFLSKALDVFLGELRAAFSLMGLLASLMLVCALINNLQDSFGKNGVSSAARFSVFVYLATISASIFSRAVAYVSTVLTDITVLMQGIIPSIATLCMAGGAPTMAAIAHPVIFFICSTLCAIINKIITPLVLLRAVTVFLCGVSQNNGMNEFSLLFSKVHKTLLAFSMTIFAGILGISRFAAVSFDTLAARGIKFAVSATVPVVGGSLSEAMQSVAGSSLLLKNAVGISGVIMLFAVFAVPLLKLYALIFAYRLAAAVAAPVADAEIIETLKKSGECIEMLFSSVACMGIIMVIAIAALL